jgi:hypothetical protein
LICRTKNQQRHYALYDANGSVTALVDNNSNVVERYMYDPYGWTTYLAPDFTPRTKSNYDWKLLWQTGHRDPITGIYLGSDGAAYHERLGRTLNPQVGMAQSEADFAANYQKAIDTTDPETINLIKSPTSKNLSYR